jgi:AraC-like DNA-binding protein
VQAVESLEAFYKRKFDWIPEHIQNAIGHFNVFRLDPYVGQNAQPVPYKRRDFYKVTLVLGGGRLHYADKVIDVPPNALTFTSPQIPYKWENTQNARSGYFCIFNGDFFKGFGSLDKYAVYQPQGDRVFELSDAEVAHVSGVFERMLAEIGSEYAHKYDLLRNQVFELLHFAMKKHPVLSRPEGRSTASQRISALFMELVERQFPIDEDHRSVRLRTPSDFAKQLNVHVNHLNRAIRETTGKTTSGLIAQRLLQEARILLRHSHWSIAEVAYALGFKEPTHFSNFFKKGTGVSPSGFRRHDDA